MESTKLPNRTNKEIFDIFKSKNYIHQNITTFLILIIVGMMINYNNMNLLTIIRIIIGCLSICLFINCYIYIMLKFFNDAFEKLYKNK